MSATVMPLVFGVAGTQVVGLLHQPAAPSARHGVVLVVGGPQYRVGSHRQFVLLARVLAAAGHPVLRFDYRGMGDSDGEARDFTAIDADIRAAIDALLSHAPGLDGVVLWGLCDAASAALLYAPGDARVRGLILLNPWVRSDQTLARAYLSGWYALRVLQPAFWRKLASGGVDLRSSLRAFLATLRQAVRRDPAPQTAADPPLPARMAQALRVFSGPVLLVLSGNDLTAGEFREHARSPAWHDALSRPDVSQFSLEAADHTFSRRAWRDAVAQRCVDWLRAISP